MARDNWTGSWPVCSLIQVKRLLIRMTRFLHLAVLEERPSYSVEEATQFGMIGTGRLQDFHGAPIALEGPRIVTG